MKNPGNEYAQSSEALLVQDTLSSRCTRGGYPSFTGLRQGGLHYSLVILELHMLLYLSVLPASLQIMKGTRRFHAL